MQVKYLRACNLFEVCFEVVFFFFETEIWFKRSLNDIKNFSCSLRSTAVFRSLWLGLQCAGSEMYAWHLFSLIISKSDLRKQTYIYFVLFTSRMRIPTINTSTNKCTQYNTIYDKYKSPTCFGSGALFLGSPFYEGIKTQHANLGVFKF